MNVNRLALFCAILAIGGWLFAACAVDSSSPPTVEPSGTGSGAPIGAVAQPCVPDCAGKTCGFDGCYSQCGICPSGQSCEQGQCTAYQCVPACDGRECGNDGCGGSCGTCGDGLFCLDAAGTCNLPEEQDNCQGITYEGCCQGEIAVWCEDGELSETDCAGEPSCGWVPELGYYCDSDGGVDPSGELPKECPNCTPNCTGASCGDDGCGGSCGTCGGGTVCEGGTCVTNGCMGVGADGCCDGEVSTWCEGGELKTEDCAGQVGSCGWTADSGYYCQSDGGVDPGGLPKDCGFGSQSCTPNCAGKTCGPDGCGGSCGTCAGGASCVAGACEADDNPCAPYTDQGCCDGQKVIWCEDGEVLEWLCDSGCGWDPSIDEYDCDMDGAEEPTGTHPKDCP